MARTYEWVSAKGDDGDRVLLQHYGDEGMRTRVLEAHELKDARAWQIANLLNDAYRAGREHAMEELRKFIGAK